MAKKLVKFKSWFPQIPNALLLLGLISVVFGATSYYQAERRLAQAKSLVSPTLKERQLAIEAAKRAGAKEYSFTTRFTPGIGIIGDPEEAKRQWEAETRKQLQGQ